MYLVDKYYFRSFNLRKFRVFEKQFDRLYIINLTVTFFLTFLKHIQLKLMTEIMEYETPVAVSSHLKFMNFQRYLRTMMDWEYQDWTIPVYFTVVRDIAERLNLKPPCEPEFWEPLKLKIY